jgi:redox-sensitive bicupin YhaK (pirin superfamily)
MITIRRANDRGHFNFGWLDTYHTFSFGEYYDPDHMHFRSLRVINEDKVHPGGGFPTHPHRDMEIITYVLEGQLAHKDSMGNGSVIRPGEVQRMSAGTGITHSEFNHSKNESVHLLQIWLLPNKRGVTPSYEQKFFDKEEKQGKLRLVASPDGSDGSVTIHQDAKLYTSILEPGQKVEYKLENNRGAWLHVARGTIELNGQKLFASDGASANGEQLVTLQAVEPAEVLLFDLA